MTSTYQLKTPFKHGADIEQICSPLFSSTNIDFMEFVRSYRDGSYLTLCNEINWLEYYFEHKLYLKTCFHGDPQLYKKSYLLTDNLEHSQDIVKASSELFHINHCLSMVIPGNNYVDTFIFGTRKKDYSIYNFYFNNIDLLERFIYYFYDAAENLIKEHLKDKFKFPHNSSLIIKKEFSNFQRQKGLKQSLDVKNFILQGDLQCRLSKREVECLHWLEQGKSCEEIGIILNISGRTVESHLTRIKKKLNCYKISQLVSLARQHAVL